MTPRIPSEAEVWVSFACLGGIAALTVSAYGQGDWLPAIAGSILTVITAIIVTGTSAAYVERHP